MYNIITSEHTNICVTNAKHKNVHVLQQECNTTQHHNYMYTIYIVPQQNSKPVKMYIHCMQMY